MEILKDNPKQASWKIWYDKETNHIFTGNTRYNDPGLQGYSLIPNPVFTAKFKIDDIYPTASALGFSLKECDCPLFAALKDDYGKYTCTGQPAKEIIFRILQGKLTISGDDQGWFEGTFTIAKKGAVYTIELYDDK